MKKEYDTSVKEAIERVMSVFSEYIKTTPYFDIVWSGKVGYIYISIDSCRGTVSLLQRLSRAFQGRQVVLAVLMGEEGGILPGQAHEGILHELERGKNVCIQLA